jgi:hypothetical protein
MNKHKTSPLYNRIAAGFNNKKKKNSEMVSKAKQNLSGSIKPILKKGGARPRPHPRQRRSSVLGRPIPSTIPENEVLFYQFDDDSPTPDRAGPSTQPARVPLHQPPVHVFYNRRSVNETPGAQTYTDPDETLGQTILLQRINDPVFVNSMHHIRLGIKKLKEDLDNNVWNAPHITNIKNLLRGYLGYVRDNYLEVDLNLREVYRILARFVEYNRINDRDKFLLDYHLNHYIHEQPLVVNQDGIIVYSPVPPITEQTHTLEGRNRDPDIPPFMADCYNKQAIYALLFMHCYKKLGKKDQKDVANGLESLANGMEYLQRAQNQN